MLLANASACDNFYEFVCAKRWRFPGHGDAASTDNIVIGNIQDAVWKHIKSGKADADKSASDAVSLWKGCMDLQAIGNLGTVPFRDALNRSGLSGWPFDEFCNLTVSDIWNISGTIVRRLNLDTLVNVRTERRTNTSSDITVVLGRSPAPLSARNFQNNETVSTFLSKVVRAMRFIKPDDNTTDGAAVEVLNFALRLANLNAVRNKEAVSPPNSNLSTFLASAFAGLLNTLGTNVKVKFESRKYTEELFQLVGAVPARVVLNYLGYRVIDLLWIFSPEDAGEASEPGEHRERDCLRMTERVFPMQVLLLGYRIFGNNLNFTYLKRLKEETKRRVVNTLRSLSWMDHVMTKNSVEQLTSISVTLFFPEPLLMNTSLLTSMRNTSTPPAQVLELYKEAARQKYAISVGLQESTKHRLNYGLFDLECSYDSKSGELYVPLSATNMTAASVSPYINLLRLPRLGVRLAHCLLQSVLEAPAGGESPWTPVSKSKYRTIQQCFAQRFPAVLDPVEMITVAKNPEVVSRDIFQHVAVRMAHLEFRNSIQKLRKNFSDYRLARAEQWSSEQLFYVYYADSLCETYDNDWKFRQFELRKSSPMADRVNLALSYDESFHRAFRCRKGFGMHPRRVCNAW